MRGWVGGLPPIGLGVKGAGSKNCKRWAACWAPEQPRKIFFTVVPLLTSAASAPWRPSHAGAGMLHKKCFQDSEVWRLVTNTDVKNVLQDKGVVGGGG